MFNDVPLIYILLAVILFTGFTVIFLSVATSPLADETSFLRVKIQTHIEKTNALMESKNKEIESLYKKLKERDGSIKGGTSLQKEAKAITVSDVVLTTKQHDQNDSLRPGVIVLGMHRSGTSVLGGLINKMGLKTGGPLISPGEDNKKGFFERIDVVLQNDYIMKRQQIHYAGGTHRYDALQGLSEVLKERYKEGSTFFKEGERGLAFLNNKDNYPWMLKVRTIY